jgi:hypothetical protein
VLKVSGGRLKIYRELVWETCREMRWPQENFRRKRHKACKAIADGLNRDGIPAL